MKLFFLHFIVDKTKNLLYYINIEIKEEKLMKKFVKITAITIAAIAWITLSIFVFFALIENGLI